MTSATPLVSIIMPCYNSAAFLERTLRSIIGQSYPHWELILVDDGSTDKTLQIAARFSTQDNRISFYTRPEPYQRGGRGAKNYGFTLCRGTYVVFFDSDDYMLKTYLADRVNTMLGNPNVDAVFSDFGWKVPSNLIPTVLYKYHEDFNTKFLELRYSEVFWKSFLDLNFFWVPSNLMWKKSAISLLQWNEDTTIGEDFEFNSRAILNGLQFYGLHQVNWYYMRNENSMIATSETAEQLDKRSFFMYLVATHLKSSLLVENTDALLLHIVKHQYRIVRRIALLNVSVKSRKEAIKTVVSRILDGIQLLESVEKQKMEKRKFKRAKFVVLFSLYTKKGHALFDWLLIGKREKTAVLPSAFIRLTDPKK